MSRTGSSVSETARSIIDVMEYTKQQNIPAAHMIVYRV